MTTTQPSTPASGPTPRHEVYIPGYRLPKLGLALLGLMLIALSMTKFGPFIMLAINGGSTMGEAVAVIRTDAAGQETVYRADADVIAAVKQVEDMRDRETVFWVKYRIVTPDGKAVEVRSPIGQHQKPMQPLRDSDGLPSTITVWYDKADPQRIVHPWLLGTWFMPSMLALFGLLGFFMGMMLWWNANKPIEMPDLSQSHGEKDNGPAKH